MLFSVIIPVYNVEQYLDECINSVLGQTFTDYEVILVNDGSSDSSPNICDRYAALDSRIRVFHKPNGGQSSARNLGIKHASGKYLLFIDSDDFFSGKDCFRNIAQNLASSPDILVYGYHKYYSDTNRDGCGINLSGLKGLDKLELIKILIKRDSFFCSCWSKVVKRELITENNVSFDENLRCEDMDWYFNVLKYSNSIEVLDLSVINYRQRVGSVTSGGFKLKTLTDYLQTINLWRSDFEARPSAYERTTMLNALAKLYCNLLISYSSHKDKAKELKEAIFKHKTLLKYDLNPRTKKFKRVTSVIGIDLFTSLLFMFIKFKR